MGYALKLHIPAKLEKLSLVADNAGSMRPSSDFIVIQPLPAWSEVFSFYEKSDAEVRSSTVSMAMFFMIDREMRGSPVEDGVSCKPYFQNKIFVQNFLKLCSNDKSILSVAFTILNFPVKDKNWTKVKDQIFNNLETIRDSRAYFTLKNAHKLPDEIVDKILKMDLITHELNLRHEIRVKSSLNLRREQFEMLFLEVQRKLIDSLWLRKNKRVSIESFDRIFDFHNLPTLAFEENVKVLITKLENEETTDFIDDFFDYLTVKWSNGIDFNDYKVLTEKHYKRFQELSGLHSYDLLEKTCNLLMDEARDEKTKSRINSRILFWSKFKQHCNGVKIFINEQTITNQSVYQQRKDILISKTSTVFIIKFETFYFVQYLDYIPGRTIGCYFSADNKRINEFYNAPIFTDIMFNEIKRVCDWFTFHENKWQKVVGKFLIEEQKLSISPYEKNKLLSPDEEVPDLQMNSVEFWQKYLNFKF